MEDAAHTISQRLRQLKKIPAELIPLGTLFRHASRLSHILTYAIGLTMILGVVLA
jgi:hypothetical protein